MIKVNHRLNENMYEIIWEPVQNVNHGLVSYTVKVLHEEDKKVDSRVSISLKINIFVLVLYLCYIMNINNTFMLYLCKTNLTCITVCHTKY